MKVSKVIAAVLAATMVSAAFVGVCTTASATTNTKTENDVFCENMINPWTDCQQDMELAKEISGVEFNIPVFSNYTIHAMKGIIEVVLLDGDNNEITFRKGISTDDNLSGIYDCDFKAIDSMLLDGLDAMFGFGSDGKIYAVNWNDGNFEYSISSDKGMTDKEALNRVDEIASKNVSNSTVADD